MAQTVKMRRSSTSGAVPTTGNLSLGEIAINTYDGRLFTKKNDGSDSVVEFMSTAGGTFTSDVSFEGDVTVKGDSTNGSGSITLNCENNSHGVSIQGPPHSAGATYTLVLPNNVGTNGQVLTTDGSGTLSFTTVSSGGGGGSVDFDPVTASLIF